MWWLPLLLVPASFAELLYSFMKGTGANQILGFATRGLDLYLACFVSAYLAWLLRRETSTTVRRVAWLVVLLCALRVCGFALAVERPALRIDVMQPIEEHDSRIEATCTQSGFIASARCAREMRRHPIPTLFTLDADHRFVGDVHFTSFPPDLQSYLDRAARGEIRMSMQSYFFFQYYYDFVVTTDGIAAPFARDQSRYALDASQAAAFAKNGTVHWQTAVPAGATWEVNARRLQARNAPKLAYRADSMRVDGALRPTPNGGDLFVVLFFETLEHIPLAVFY